MSVVGRVESLWRYPVKSMRGEELQQAFVGFGGIDGDRRYTFHNSGAREDFPYLTGREQGKMLLCRPVQRDEGDVMLLDVETPEGARFALDNEKLREMLRQGIREGDEITLLKSDSAMADCSPVSLLSVQTVRQLSQELSFDLDKRRFRANIYLDLGTPSGFAEDEFVGRRLQIGATAVVVVVKRDERCKMITLDPDTATPNPEIMKLVARAHEGRVGIYGDVVVEGTARPGDSVVLLDG